MTREEAIGKWIYPAISTMWNEKKCQEIIKALEQDQCEDCISRQAVWDVMQELWGTSGELLDRLMALPSVNPQEPFKPMVEIDLYSVIKQKYIERDALDKIRAEIEQSAFEDVNGSKYIFVNRVNQIIDKYKEESEKV